MNGALILSNVESNDITFDSDVGSWNVTRAIQDCNAGKHKIYGFCVNDLYKAIQNVEVDKDKIKRLTTLKKLKTAPPIILIVERGKVWVIDGHHRIHAHKQVGISRMLGFVIEEEVSARYIIWYNGQRTPPWHSKK